MFMLMLLMMLMPPAAAGYLVEIGVEVVGILALELGPRLQRLLGHQAGAFQVGQALECLRTRAAVRLAAACLGGTEG